MKKTKKTVVKSWPEAVNALHLRAYKLDGIDGMLHVLRDTRQHFKVRHEASITGMRKCDALGRRHSTPLNDRPELSKIVAALGIVIDP